jgi:malate dehydrogenase (oxaloacetate-decarboxylating)
MVAAKALAECSPAKNNPEANLLPPLNDIREVSFKVALAVAKEAVRSGLSKSFNEDELERLVRAKMWDPAYLPYKLAKSCAFPTEN